MFSFRASSLFIAACLSVGCAVSTTPTDETDESSAVAETSQAVLACGTICDDTGCQTVCEEVGGDDGGDDGGDWGDDDWGGDDCGYDCGGYNPGGGGPASTPPPPPPPTCEELCDDARAEDQERCDLLSWIGYLYNACIKIANDDVKKCKLACEL